MVTNAATTMNSESREIAILPSVGMLGTLTTANDKFLMLSVAGRNISSPEWSDWPVRGRALPLSAYHSVAAITTIGRLAKIGCSRTDRRKRR